MEVLLGLSTGSRSFGGGSCGGGSRTVDGIDHDSRTDILGTDALDNDTLAGLKT